MREREFGITGRLIPAIDREASPRRRVEMVRWVDAHRRDEVHRHRHRLPRGRPAARAVRRGLSRRPARRPEDHRARRRVRHALDQRAHRARRCCRSTASTTATRWSTSPTSRARCAERGIAVHRGADQLLLPAHAAARALGARPPDPPHARPGPAHPPQHRRPDLAPGHADRAWDDDGARLRLRPGRPARLHAQRPRRRPGSTMASAPLARAMDGRVRRRRPDPEVWAQASAAGAGQLGAKRRNGDTCHPIDGPRSS